MTGVAKKQKQRRPALTPAKTTAETTAAPKPAVGELIPQPHGGALRNGGTNKGGHGALPSAIREILREDYVARLPRLRRFADGVTELRITEKCPQCGFQPPKKRQDLREVFVSPETSLKALDHMIRHGMSARGLDPDEVRHRMRQTLEVVRRRLQPEEAEGMIAEMKQYWTQSWQGGGHARTG